MSSYYYKCVLMLLNVSAYCYPSRAKQEDLNVPTATKKREPRTGKLLGHWVVDPNSASHAHTHTVCVCVCV